MLNRTLALFVLPASISKCMCQHLSNKNMEIHIDTGKRCGIIYLKLVDCTTILPEENMDITKREMTKIARELSKLTVRTLRADGIGASELDVLHAVRKNPGVTQAGVCDITGLDKGAVARQTANLEAKGYLVRKENPADGRSRLLYATEKANELKNSKAHIEAAFYEWLLQALPEHDREELARLLDILYHRCKEESKAGFPEMNALLKGGASLGE